jgi:hypothetical protein
MLVNAALMVGSSASLPARILWYTGPPLGSALPVASSYCLMVGDGG